MSCADSQGIRGGTRHAGHGPCTYTGRPVNGSLPQHLDSTLSRREADAGVAYDTAANVIASAS